MSWWETLDLPQEGVEEIAHEIALEMRRIRKEEAGA
jgi:hypothetical protein